MGKVIEMKRSSRETSGQLAAALRGLLIRAEMGELTGLMYVASREGRKIDSGIGGLFATDLVFAAAAASEGFNCLLGHKACIEKVGIEIKRGMRKDASNEETHCAVTSCRMRR